LGFNAQAANFLSGFRNASPPFEFNLIRETFHGLDGNRYVVAQRMIMDDLERDGFDTIDAELFLDYLEEAQAAYIAYRDRLERKLARLVTAD
jgi:hypothetical protein